MASDRHNLPKYRRMGKTAICFLLVSSLSAGFSIYVDSMSIAEWNSQTQVGPVAMIVQGHVDNGTADEMRGLSYVTRAARLDTSYAIIRRDFLPGWDPEWEDEMWHLKGTVLGLAVDYEDVFPDVFQILEGVLPSNSSQIALPLDVADPALISIGQKITYGPSLSEERLTLDVVGIYNTTTPAALDYFFDGIAIVVPELLPDDKRSARVDVDVDRSHLTVSDPSGTLSYLVNIEGNVLAFQSEQGGQEPERKYVVSNFLAARIRNYMSSLSETRILQLTRAQGIIVVAVLIVYIGVRHNLSEWRTEVVMLSVRGASRLRLDKYVLTELLGLSLLLAPVGLCLGILASRIPMSSIGFLEFDANLLYTQPVLLTVDTAKFVLITQMLLPFLAYLLARKTLEPPKEPEEQVKGGIAKATRALGHVRWDMSVLVLCLVLLSAYYLGGTAARDDPLISLVPIFVPVPLLAGIASLAARSLSLAATPISRAMSAAGGFAASIGVRRIGRNGGLSGPAMLVLVLAVCVSLSSGFVAASVPQTELNDMRFLIGGDIAFHLSEDYTTQWSAFIESIDNHSSVLVGCYALVGSSYLMEGSQGKVKFIAIDPEEYRGVGYDYLGVELTSSFMGSLMDALESSPGGAIVTNDIAQEYELTLGDKFRLSSLAGDEAVEFNVLGVSTALSEPTTSLSAVSRAEIVGSRKVWLNLDYLRSELNVTASTETFYCVRTAIGCNGEKLVGEILGVWGNEILSKGEWAAVSRELGIVTSREDYQMDRAADNLAVVALAFAVPLAFSISALEEAGISRRENALLRSLGANRSDTFKTQVAHTLGLLVFSVAMILVYDPLFSLVSLETSLRQYGLQALMYPVAVFPAFPFILLLPLFGLFLLLALSSCFLTVGLSYETGVAGALEASRTKSNHSEVMP